MRARRRFAWAMLIAAAMAWGASARAEAPQFMLVQPLVDSQEAFASPYGQSIIDELGVALRKGADPACLAERRVMVTELRARGADVLIRHSQKRMARVVALIDAASADREFARAGGPGAIEEWRKLQIEARVVEFMGVLRPLDIVELVDETIDMFDRFVKLMAMNLDAIAPANSGSEKLNKLREEIEEQAVNAADDLSNQEDNVMVRRYLELAEMASDALSISVNRAELQRLGPTDWMAGLDEDLRGLCIGKR